jgi:hypothetical protein
MRNLSLRPAPCRLSEDPSNLFGLRFHYSMITAPPGER